MKKITNISRLLLAFASLMMLGAYYFPLWRIDLWAPQYPEGLKLYIWHNKLGGDVEIINGLNHYIGMAHLKQESFPEFGILPYLIAGFAALGLVVAAVGKWRGLVAYLSLIVLAGVVALADFYRWGYEYGHNLDPNAAIKVPDMSYQPPVIGYKSLLNFGAFSIPDVGGWFFIVAGAIVACLVGYEWWLNQKIKTKNTPLSIVSLLFGSMLFVQCSSQVEPINYGHDACDYCKMTIVDNRFGCELVTDKGKIFKFDDLSCMVGYVKEKAIDDSKTQFFVVNNYREGGKFLNIKEAVFAKSLAFKSPMRGDVAAFKTLKAVEKEGIKETVLMLSWQDLKNEF